MLDQCAANLQIAALEDGETPADMPVAVIPARIAVVPGWAFWPFVTTVPAAANAEAVSPPAVENASGKFDASKMATGPIGR